MPGTGIKGYTGSALYGGNYSINNGIISSGSGANSSGVANRNGAVNNAGSSTNGIISKVSNAVAESISNVSNANNLASGIASTAGYDTSDYGDYIRELLDISANNTAQSQAFAREQMEYQRQSDANAMAWSAQEAQKNRDWQERLSNTAHQREVQDLLAAGLNPILSANAGAYTGSGATGQGFSSSGAMGNVDTSAGVMAGNLYSTIMNTASNAYIAKLYTDAERYNSDLNYSSSRLATEASILNNQNTTNSQKAIASAQMENDLEKTRLSGEYGLSNTALSGEYGLKNTELHNEGLYKTEQYKQEGENTRTVVKESNANKRNRETNEANERMNQYKVDYGSLYSVGAAKTVSELIADVGKEGVAAFYDLKKKYEQRGKPNPILNKIFGAG